MADKVRVGILGASGYTGAELLRLLVTHPHVAITALTADRRAGQDMADIFPQFTSIDLPRLVTIAEVDLDTVDAVFCALPHGTTQGVISSLLQRKPELKIIDLSADFRLADPKAYETWYGHPHQALHLQDEAAFGLVELNRDAIQKARLVANPGCHSSTAILPVVPLLRAGLIDPDYITVDSKTGMSGAGRSAKEEMLYSEVSDGLHAYGVGRHRHTSEIDQEYSKAAGREVLASFTPHLAPMIRGIYATIYVRTKPGFEAPDLHAALEETYHDEPFVRVLPYGQVPQSRHIKGSNNCYIGVIADRVPGRAIVISTLDNLTKGASGQAVQNFNLVYGFPETTALPQVAVFP